MSNNNILRRHGELGTFMIHVQHEQNSSWQGRITWMERNQTINFRSAWEMVKLIASAVEESSEEEVVRRDPSWSDDIE